MDSYEGDLTDTLNLHKYTYARNDSVTRVDPSGFADATLNGQLITVGLVGIIASIALLNAVKVTDRIKDITISEVLPQNPLAPTPSPSPSPSPSPTPNQKPKPEPKDDSNKLNRGRIQAQGNDIWFALETDLGFGVKGKGDTISFSWTQFTPLTWTEGIEALGNIEIVLTKKQYKVRDEALKKAERFINNSAIVGGASAPATGSWQNEEVRKRRGDERVDIEVWEGKAFVP
jgi:hypothetical protein